MLILSDDKLPGKEEIGKKKKEKNQQLMVVDVNDRPFTMVTRCWRAM